MKEQIKNNEKEKTYKIRLLREINNGLISKLLENQHQKNIISNLMRKQINTFQNKLKHIYY